MKVGQVVTVLHFGTPVNAHLVHTIKSIGPKWICTDTGFRVAVNQPRGFTLQ